MNGRWIMDERVTPRGRRYWFIWRTATNGVEAITVAYSGVARRWYVEQKARDYLAQLLRRERRVEQMNKRAAEAPDLSTCWPFKDSYHDWSTP